ncbi:hypothetical protein [Cognatishimia sp. F0-27]|uniref:hypothetical protein n=1 Tax=Cognatishimia sp. F0-27 TaxID=2816855 RepID=UPI001D0C39AD|nr:hypothetical protein [Cognatishimia sp. F0-27]MCC1493970.1 hypothetical protein [Cognatishimia sp. F0-27]
MDDALIRFRRRETEVRAKHARMARGYVTKIDKNTGLIVQCPDSKAAGFGLRLLFAACVGFFLFKAFLFAGLGPETYNSNVLTLQAGSLYEQAGAWLMQADPITRFVGGLIAPLLG